jgi:hypothetical protein
MVILTNFCDQINVKKNIFTPLLNAIISGRFEMQQAGKVN